MRFAIITDIHEDYHNLVNVLHVIEKSNCDEIVCLGDISGFSLPYYKHSQYRNAHGCLDLIREKCSIVVVGNHDIYATKKIPETSPQFEYPDNWYSLDYHQRKERAGSKIWLHEEDDLDPLYTKEDIEFLKKQPQYAIQETEAGNILFSHYAYPNISGVHKTFYTYADEFTKHFEFMNKLGCIISIIGHAHSKMPTIIHGKKIQNIQKRIYQIRKTPICISCPPVTRYGNKSRFCIFDTQTFELKTFKV